MRRRACGRGSREAGGARDAGMATAEMAVALPALVVVLTLALWAQAAVVARLRCVDAAREAARELARGETRGAALEAARAAAPAGARVSLSEVGDRIGVEVSASVGLPGAGRVHPSVTVSATAVTLREPG